MSSVLNLIKSVQYIPIFQGKAETELHTVLSHLEGVYAPIMEIPLRCEEAPELLQLAKKTAPHFKIGAGSVSTVSDAEKALDCGADYLMSAGVNDRVMAYALDRNIPIFPGVYTPSDVEKAIQYDLKIMKFFPANAPDSMTLLDAFYGPYPELEFIATGGVDDYLRRDFLECQNVVACGGSWPIKPALSNTPNLEELDRRLTLFYGQRSLA
ncbi:hypothetical protein QGN29_06760 [Temperatibacter marinus]|uniref:Uncharacterized protein n=1 Tax=Temperatibacter marinus TaxID=1456591 RepID=A0AA52HBW4_9PROT|nr:hypothetical protein [Temperatibacter marinus]WND04073.1 hypothetical protein QGN29_06760 [Temperatibacter marinus]